MKKSIIEILNNYLNIFPEERKRQTILFNFLENHTDNELIDWNNFDGHLVAGGFIYAKKENKFLVLYHKELKMYLYPGGHIDETDKNTLAAAKREIKEETSLTNLNNLKIDNNELIPIDIDTHIIPYNEYRNLPQHYHFDFRYLFIIDQIENVKLDTDESSDYKWINLEELRKDINYGKIVTKLEKLLNK